MDRVEEIFGRRLAQHRKLRGLTQQELARRVKLDDKHLGALERGEKAPSFAAITRLAKVLQVAHYELFLPDGIAVGQLETSIKVVLRNLSKVDGKAIEPFLLGLLNAVQKLERGISR